MTKIALIAIALAACAGDDPHEIVTCDPAWQTTGTCERACEMVPANFGGSGTDMPCDAIHAGHVGSVSCSRTFEFEGTWGCCVPAPDAVSLQFFECEHQP